MLSKIFTLGGIVEKKALFLSALVGLFAPNGFATVNIAELQQTNSRECTQTIKQLQMMSLAQKSLLDSMLKKNEVLASTLDQYASDFEARGQKIRRADLASLRNSANAFRKHELREQVLIQKFETQSEKLIAKANDCLDESNKPNTLRQSSNLNSSK